METGSGQPALPTAPKIRSIDNWRPHESSHVPDFGNAGRTIEIIDAELGARHVGIVQSLLITCRLHDINPYDYFVDVLQRIGQHPASLVH